MLFNLVDLRRSFHQIPEPGFKEYQTQALILDYLDRLPQDRLVIKTWETGVLVKIEGTAPQQTIGYRTDIDGLPIEEETGYDFRSQHDGWMHACGHDFHITIGLGVIEQLLEKPLRDNVVVIFQPAEEGPGGARPMQESAVFQDWLPDMIFALHVAPELPTGTLALKEGLLFANTSELFIDFHGKGGHAAYPHLANDMVVAASAFVTQLQSIVSRRVDPMNSGVITIGKIDGGTKQNIIAEKARVEGTIRALSPESMKVIQQEIEAHVAGIEAAYHCQASIDYGSHYYQVTNDADFTQSFLSYCRRNDLPVQICDAAMTGEDFGYFLKNIPGFMFWLGVDSTSGLHSSTLKPHEPAMEQAVKAVSGYINDLASE
ncbi:N-acetyldiaminopimelate deacetylase [Tuberibacillus sp. Marseille-P3662]|uniref:N-acetyldiaminopimelate deacetylase n=1 Tax=Tuberibacillus sp. Marseille-P3662 TaxID=1965358 RepID=UPI000A1CEE00|nr:N-acetyldiaminopimelate deacetylase [Tuberibacillus sp. Marseille-P3662]